HHLAGLADIAELLGELQQANLGADDLLFSRHASPNSPTLGALPPRPLCAPAPPAIRPWGRAPLAYLVLAYARTARPGRHRIWRDQVPEFTSSCVMCDNCECEQQPQPPNEGAALYLAISLCLLWDRH